MPEQRHRCLAPGVVTLSWIDAEGAQQQEYAPLHEVWEDGGQLHVEQAAPIGATLRVIMEDGGEVTGEVQTCTPDETFGYIIDVTMNPKHTWLSGPHAQYLTGKHRLDLLKAS